MHMQSPKPTHNDLVVMVTTVYAHFSPPRETLQFKRLYVGTLLICHVTRTVNTVARKASARTSRQRSQSWHSAHLSLRVMSFPQLAQWYRWSGASSACRDRYRTHSSTPITQYFPLSLPPPEHSRVNATRTYRYLRTFSPAQIVVRSPLSFQFSVLEIKRKVGTRHTELDGNNVGSFRKVSW